MILQSPSASNSKGFAASLKGSRSLGGCRLSAGGLHFGHLNGCFLPRRDGTTAVSYAFIVSDYTRGARIDDLNDLVQDVVACEEYVGPIHVALESDLRSALHRLFFAFEVITSFAQLRRVNPSLRGEADFDNSMATVLFPLHQATFIVGLNAGTIFMNDDNRDLVDFAASLAKRANSAVGSAYFVTPRLTLGPVDCILGFDYRRMAKANQNVLRLGASDAALRKFVLKAVRSRNSPRRPRHTLMPDYLPFEYARAFDTAARAAAVEESYRAERSADEELQEYLYELLSEVRAPWLRRRSVIRYSSRDIQERLANDAAALISDINEHLSNFYWKGF